MSVQELIEALKKLPQNAQLCDVRLKISSRWHDTYDIKSVVWQGNHTTLENK